MNRSPDPVKTCSTCGFHKHEQAEAVCSHPELSRANGYHLLAALAFRICKSRKWVEREDEE